MGATFGGFIAAALGCAILGQPVAQCTQETFSPTPEVAGIQSSVPIHTGDSVDVVLTAQSAIVWDVTTGKILYEKAAHEQRPVASLTKLVSALAVHSLMSPSTVVEITPDVRKAQLSGANVKLPIGQHVTVQQLLGAGLIPSANDAMVALAVGTSGSEEEFVAYANNFAAQRGFNNTLLANATGLEGGEQHSSAYDIMHALSDAYADPLLNQFLSQKKGTLTTIEGATRAYESTNDLLGTYMPILAGKTGYTVAAKENLAIITTDDAGHKIGAVVLASDQRFQDMKILVEWIWRNFEWPVAPGSPDKQ